ncbi:tyrosinase-domain-containing protein [Thozetella sp. PMI_491]|nr:tyrosinase-domain-containing protein [Thozetella sp. PMI_491]
MAGNVQITGVPNKPNPDGSFPLRREIRDLQKNFPDQFNLYILGLRLLQGVSEDELTSYYQIAGIHGMPFKPWDNVQGNTDWSTDPQGFGGYCTHSSILFTTWHRPYLALFEQSLYAAVQAAVQQFPESLRGRYEEAAQDFRMPYFDWAIIPPTGSSGFPAAISSAKISVVDIDGKSKSIDNPLYQYTFNPLNPQPQDFDDQWSQYPTTVRYPDQNGNSHDSQITSILNNENGSLRNNVSILLLSYHQFDGFSSNQWNNETSPGAYGSLEDIHNEIHDKTGGPGGHMSALEVSAFDPIFWLHHTNVDRLWAIWQGLNPDAFITPQPAPYPTFWAERGDSQTADSPLVPFWDQTGSSFWTSNQVKDSSIFGYAYPETQKWKYANTDDYQTSIRQAVVRLYGGNVFSNFIQTIASQMHPAGVEGNAGLAAPAGKQLQQPLKGEENGKAVQSSGPIPAALAHLAPNNKYSEWIVNVRALKHGLGQSFRILVFLGDFSPDSSTWNSEPNCVGRVSILGRSPATACGKCQHDRNTNLVVSGTVPLTSALLQDIVEGRLRSLEPADVVPYLRENLTVKATLFSGQERAVDEIPGLKVSVCSTEVEIGVDGLPVYSGTYIKYPEITNAFPGVVGREDA